MARQPRPIRPRARAVQPGRLDEIDRYVLAFARWAAGFGLIAIGLCRGFGVISQTMPEPFGWWQFPAMGLALLVAPSTKQRLRRLVQDAGRAVVAALGDPDEDDTP